MKKRADIREKVRREISELCSDVMLGIMIFQEWESNPSPAHTVRDSFIKVCKKFETEGRIICDGCKKTEGRHHCHGGRSMVNGEWAGLICECAKCREDHHASNIRRVNHKDYEKQLRIRGLSHDK